MPSPPSTLTAPRSLKRLLLLVAFAYLFVFPYYPAIHSANELPRAYLVRAIVDDHSFAIDRQVAEFGSTADVSPSFGHQYSNKAPGASLIAVPFYALLDAIVGPPSLATTVWLCRVVAGVIPTLLLIALLWGFLARYLADAKLRSIVIVAYALGSMAMTYSMLFYSHQLGATCIAAAWIFAVQACERRGDHNVVIDGRAAQRKFFAIGFLAGSALLVDYQAAFAGVPIATAMIAQLWSASDKWRALAISAAGCVLPIVALLSYHSVCFGGALRTGYDASVTFAHFHQHGFLGMDKLRWEAFVGSTLAPDNGLFALSPWLLLVFPGLVWLWRRDPRLALTSAAILVIYVAFVSSLSFWRGGWGTGPRYITVVLPFLLPPVAVALDELRRHRQLMAAACALILVSIVIYAVSSATFPYWPEPFSNPLFDLLLPLLRDGAGAPNALSALGTANIVGVAAYLSAIATAVLVTLCYAIGPRDATISAVLAILLLFGYRELPRSSASAGHPYQFVRSSIR